MYVRCDWILAEVPAGKKADAIQVSWSSAPWVRSGLAGETGSRGYRLLGDERLELLLFVAARDRYEYTQKGGSGYSSLRPEGGDIRSRVAR